MTTTPAKTPSPALLKLLEKAKAARGVAAVIEHKKDVEEAILNADKVAQPAIQAEGTDRYGNTIQWNAEQQAFISLALAGKSCILIGAAGTGKTTTMRGTIESLLRSKYIPKMGDDSHKHLPSGTPGIVCVSYTRRAVSNLRRAMPPDLVNNCITIHKLLEYQPCFYEVTDPTTGDTKNKMVFEPNRHKYNPLSSNIKIVIIDESSMVSVDYFYKIWCALPDPHSVQFILLGDIQQLPPVFGSAILGYKMLEYPTVELTQVYRQALESPIIRLAHRILSGEGISVDEFDSWKFPNQLTLHPWKKSISADNALLTLAAFFRNAYDAGAYIPEDDMILVPFNKSCGTDELNKHIANHLARKSGRITWEVIAGFNTCYFSVGEKVLYEKEDARIVEIKRNPGYLGRNPQEPSLHLDYWGTVQVAETPEEHHISETTESDLDIDAMLEHVSLDDEGRTNAASHIIVVEMADQPGSRVELKTSADINALLLGYTLTIHKSQGSEWRKVFLLLHQSHNTMIQRELLYTAVTRAREELYVICEKDSFLKGIKGQRIKGNTLAEKAEFFKGKAERGDDDLLLLMKSN